MDKSEQKLLIRNDYTVAVDRKSARVLSYEEMQAAFPVCPACRDFVLDEDGYYELRVNGDPGVDISRLVIFIHLACAPYGISVDVAQEEPVVDQTWREAEVKAVIDGQVEEHRSDRS